MAAEADSGAGDGGSPAADAAGGLGQDAAIDLLLAEKPLLLGFARAIVGNRTLAEDLFQDLIILVMRKHAEIPNPEALPGWSRRALRFLCYRACERRSRERPAMDAELVDLIDATCAAAPPPPAGRWLEALAHCRDRLPERARRLLAMRYEEGIAGEEIAARLARPVNTVYVTISRLHRALGDCMRAQLRSGDA